MKRVAVLGGGPAGAYAAERFAAAGIETLIFDEKLAWEKPCGGGLTYKAYSQYPFLIDNTTPKRVITRTLLTSEAAGSAPLDLDHPLVIYSRYELNQMLLKRAEAAGAGLEKARVRELRRDGKGWRLTVGKGSIDADFCVIATGARNSLKHVGTEWSSADTMVALGYYIPIEQEYIDIHFFRGFEGYIWIFPRNNHLSAGICGKGEASNLLRQRLEKYLCRKGIPLTGATFYAHVLPSLERPAWGKNRIAGEGWMAVGDAAGLVDPITGEGLYYAIRSADLAARVVLSDTGEPAQAYRERLRREFTMDLELASRIAKRLFLGKFLYSDVPARMIQFIRRSPTFCAIMQDLFAGTQNYVDLKARLLKNVNGTLHDLLMSLYFRRIVPTANGA